MPLTHACALLLLLLAAWETAGAREGDAAERPDRGAREGASSGASSGSGGGLLRAPRQLRQARRGGVGLGQPPPVVVLYTQFGAIRVKLLEGVAPRITALVWHLGCGAQLLHHLHLRLLQVGPARLRGAAAGACTCPCCPAGSPTGC